jgi:subtilase family serine protease
MLSVSALVLGLILAAPAQAATRSSARAASTTSVKTRRSCGTAAVGHRTCFALKRTDVTQPVGVRAVGISPNATPSGISPSNLVSAYKLPSSTAGSGQTVAVVDAYNDPNAAADLAVYRSQYGLSACTVANGCFRQVNQSGATSPLPSNDSGWAGEISLDLDMVSAVCPNCKIILVEANSASDANLYAAEDEAVALGAKFVSNSWGGSEYSGQTTDDSHFNHPGVAITVSSGDSGTGAEYPATSRYVTAVGGTHLTTSTNTRGWTESAWSSAGSGCSSYDTKPTWQTVTTNCTRRAEADVSAVADPATGVAVYQTYGGSGWTVYGGTSASAPIVASTYALAGAPAAGSYPASFPYSSASSLFDVTSGSNGSCGSPICSSGTGWDGPTGLGTPNGVAAFTSGTTTGNTITVTNPGAQTATVGTAFSLQISASDSASGQTLTYAASGLPTGLSISSSTGLISGTPTASGSFSATVTVTDTTGASGSTSFTTTVSGGTSGGCTSTQLLGNAGFETGSASPWTASSGVISATGGTETSHAGTYFAWLDGYGSTHTDTLSQSVTIPAACTGTTLSFWIKIDTAETTTSTAYDKLTVKAGSTTLASYSNLNHAGYAQKSFSLGSFAGQTVTLTFTGTEDSSLQTSFVIDDTAITTS